MSDPVVFFQYTTENVDRIRCTECVSSPPNLHLEVESLAGDLVTLCMNDYEVDQLQDWLNDWLRFVDAERTKGEGA